MANSINSGYKQSLFWGNETLYGSAAVIGQPMGLVQSINPTETNNLIKIRTLGGTRDFSNIVPGKFEISGSFDYYLQQAPFLRQVIGEDTATSATIDSGPKFHTGGTGAGGYLHVMGSAASPEALSFPSFTLEFTDAEDSGAAADTNNLKRRYTGCRVNSATINGTVDEPLKVSVDWMAQNVIKGTGAATSVTESTKDPFVFYQGAVYATSAAVTAYTSVITGTAAIAQVNSFDITVNNNLESTWYVCGTTNVYQSLRGVKHLVPKGREYAGNLNLHFESKKQYERFLGATGATGPQSTIAKWQVVLDFVRAGTVPGGLKSSSDDWVRIVLASTAFDTENIPGGPEDLVTETLGLSVERAKVYVVDNDANYRT